MISVSVIRDIHSAACPFRGTALTGIVFSLALIAVFIALMRPLGFAISAAFYLFLQFSLLSPADLPRPHFMHAALAIGISLTMYVVFRQGFNLMLPAGPLARLMP